MKFGLIPEFIGRLPVVGAVSHLYKDALIRSWSSRRTPSPASTSGRSSSTTSSSS